MSLVKDRSAIKKEIEKVKSDAVKLSKITTNFNKINIGELTLWFSYEAIVAFSTPETGMLISENKWGNTTMQHLNKLNSNVRIPRDEFWERLYRAIKYYTE